MAILFCSVDPIISFPENNINLEGGGYNKSKIGILVVNDEKSFREIFEKFSDRSKIFECFVFFSMKPFVMNRCVAGNERCVFFLTKRLYEHLT